MDVGATPQAGQIFGLIPKIMAEVGAIEKTRKNAQQGYQFRGIDDVYAAMQSVLAKHGVFCVPEVLEQKREERVSANNKTLIYTILTVRHSFFAADGSHVDAVMVGEAMDSGDKSANKAMSAAMKYAMLEVFCIPTSDPKDTENDSPEPKPAYISQAELDEIGKLMDEITVPEADVLSWFKRARVNAYEWEKLPARAGQGIITILKKRLADKAA